jgi:hypothetical protein
MESRTQNTTLWKRNVEFRDNGILTIGSIIRILAPRPVESLMAGDIPLLTTNFPVVIMQPPRRYLDVPIKLLVAGDNAYGFVMNGAVINTTSFTPRLTSCSGFFCDRQRIDDWLGSERGCGCYSMHQRRSNIAFQHDIDITSYKHTTISMKNFSSLQFSKLYLSGNVSPNVLLEQIQFTAEMFEMMACIDRVLAYIHNNGGFTIIGWYKRGIINDRSLVSNNSNSNSNNNNNRNENENMKVDSGEIHFHITQILPTDRSMLDPESTMGRQLNSLKFDISKFR